MGTEPPPAAHPNGVSGVLWAGWDQGQPPKLGTCSERQSWGAARHPAEPPGGMLSCCLAPRWAPAGLCAAVRSGTKPCGTAKRPELAWSPGEGVEGLWRGCPTHHGHPMHGGYPVPCGTACTMGTRCTAGTPCTPWASNAPQALHAARLSQTPPVSHAPRAPRSLRVPHSPRAPPAPRAPSPRRHPRVLWAPPRHATDTPHSVGTPRPWAQRGCPVGSSPPRGAVAAPAPRRPRRSPAAALPWKQARCLCHLGKGNRGTSAGMGDGDRGDSRVLGPAHPRDHPPSTRWQGHSPLRPLSRQPKG